MEQVNDSGEYDLKIRRGRSYRLIFNRKVNDVPVDLSQCRFRMMVKTSATDPDPWEGFDLSTDTGTITADANGHVEVFISAAATAALPSMPKRGVYDLVMIPAVGDAKTVLEGEVILKDSVTPV